MSTENTTNSLQPNPDNKRLGKLKAPEQIKKTFAEGIADVTRQSTANAKK
jgi:hypothetical protein